MRDYAKFRILQSANVFRDEISYKFVKLDHIIKAQLESFSASRKVQAAKLMEPLTVKDVKESSVYDKYGSEIPKSIPNSKTFWNSKTHELLALHEYKGREPDLFVTLTANDRWPSITAVGKMGVNGVPPDITLGDWQPPSGGVCPVNQETDV